MLVLTRKESQTIHIGDDIVIQIVHAGKSSVRIGVEAPHAIRVMRGELAIEAPPCAARDFARTADLALECAEAA